MKKLLLSLAMAVGVSGFVMAQEQSKSLTLNNAVTVDAPATDAPVTISIDGTDSGSTTAQLRMKAGNKMTVSVAEGYEITKIEFGCSSATYQLTAENVTTDPETTITVNSATSSTMALKKAADAVVITLTNKIRFKTATVYYQPKLAEGEVAAPTISCEGNLVTIVGADGSEVYYTVNNDTPTSASTKYTESFPITATVTVKAVAIKDGVSSSVTEFVAKYIDGFASFLATDPVKGESVKVPGPITAICLSGSNLYVQDDKGGYMLLYDNNAFKALTVKNGTEFTFVKGVYQPYNGIPELTSIELGEQSDGTPAEPKLVENIAENLINAYVKLVDIDIAATSDAKTFDGVDKNGNKIVIYNSISGVEVPTGTGFTVSGIVGKHNEDMQLLPLVFEGGQAMETVEAPVFSIASGRVAKGTEVTLTCATPEAQIFYTFGDAEPDSESSLYEEPFEITADTKINAIAYKDGMLASEVVSVSYIVLPEGAEVADFNFGDPATLTPAVEAPEAGNGVDVNGKTFTAAKGVTLAVAEEGGEGANQTKPRIWNPSGANAGKMDFRIYNGWSFTVTAPEGYLLSAIEMTHYNASNKIKLSATVGTVTESGSWEMPAVAPAAEATEATGKSVTFTATATNNIQTMKVIVVPDGQSGIESVVAADENAPVEYYNLQGVRVANPTAGLYIVKQGSKVSKAIIR